MGPRVLFGFSLFAILSSPWLETAEAANPSAWKQPRWGFESPHPLSKSLVFDQPTDVKVVRPVPVAIKQVLDSGLDVSYSHSVLARPPRQPRWAAATLKESPFQFVARPNESARIGALDNALRVPATPALQGPKAPRSPASIAAPVLAVTPAAPAAVAPTKAEATSVAVRSEPRKVSVPKLAKNAMRVFVLDEEALLSGRFATVDGATVEWVGVGAGLKTPVESTGVAKGPYPLSVASRFIVRAPGYLPAVSYATAGTLSPVVMVRESRLAPILKSLGVTPDATKRIVLGKVLSSKYHPLAGVGVEANVVEPFRSYYSLGSVGLFHTAPRETGPQGDFLVTGLGAGLQYLMPTKNASAQESEAAKEWPAHLVDFTDLPEVVTTTIVESAPKKAESQVVDVFALERPETNIHVTVGGQRGVHLPDSEGELKIDDLHPRSSVDLIDIRAQGYLRTWVSAIPGNDYFPTALNLFTRGHLEKIFRDSIHEVPLQKGIVFGHLRPEVFRKSVSLVVFDGRGHQNREAKVFYFDANNVATAGGDRTHAVTQNFAIANLNAGEWHIVAVDPQTKKGLAIQVVRTDLETITQTQF